MGRDARAIIIKQGKLSDVEINWLKQVSDDSIVTEKSKEGFETYDVTFRNTCLTEELDKDKSNPLIGKNYIILECSGHHPFEWRLWLENKVLTRGVDTYAEPKESINKQIKEVVAFIPIEIEDSVRLILEDILDTDTQ